VGRVLRKSHSVERLWKSLSKCCIGLMHFDAFSLTHFPPSLIYVLFITVLLLFSLTPLAWTSRTFDFISLFLFPIFFVGLWYPFRSFYFIVSFVYCFSLAFICLFVYFCFPISISFCVCAFLSTRSRLPPIAWRHFLSAVLLFVCILIL